MKGYGEFRNAPSLTQLDVDLVVNWVEGGAPKGDDKDLPAAPLYSADWRLGKPDLVLKPGGATKVAADADEYRSIVFAASFAEDRWITAIDLRPGNGMVVHCAKFYFLKPAADASSAPMIQVRDEDSDLGAGTLLTTWMPGQKTTSFEEGVAQMLPAGSRIGVKIHYRGAGEATSDLSAVGLYFARTAPRKLVQEFPIADVDTVIPVSAELSRFKSSFTTQGDIEAVAIRPHMHPLVVSLQATAHRPDGSEEVLIWARGFQFDWEPTYYFRQPVALPKGTVVEVIAYLDNSENNQKNPNDPPKALRWPELTTDPLCALVVSSNVTGRQ
jgi:hypothetical protein